MDLTGYNRKKGQLKKLTLREEFIACPFRGKATAYQGG